MLPDQSQVFLVHVMVADGVREAVDPGSEEVLRIGQGAGPSQMRDDAHCVSVRFVDDRPVDIRPDLGHRAASTVDSDLHERHAVTVKLLHSCSSRFLVDRATRNPKEVFGLRPGVGRGRDSATRREEERCVWNDFVP